MLTHMKFQNVDIIIFQGVQCRTSDIGHTTTNRNYIKDFPVLSETAARRKKKKRKRKTRLAITKLFALHAKTKIIAFWIRQGN